MLQMLYVLLLWFAGVLELTLVVLSATMTWMHRLMSTETFLNCFIESVYIEQLSIEAAKKLHVHIVYSCIN